MKTQRDEEMLYNQGCQIVGIKIIKKSFVKSLLTLNEIKSLTIKESKFSLKQNSILNTANR